jgi:hypothetical protein
MPTITTRKQDGSVIATVKSHIIITHAGTQTYALHLHNDPVWGWRLSDPRSGGCVLHVAGQYKGIRTTTKGYTLKEIKALAFAQVEALIERIGSDRFNSTLAKAPIGETV